MGVPNERMTLPLKAWPVKYQYIPHHELQKNSFFRYVFLSGHPLKYRILIVLFNLRLVDKIKEIIDIFC